jgi:uncharacterized membrane protein YbhN (UPF0104 family)
LGENSTGLKRNALNILKYSIGIGLGALLFWFAFRDKPVSEIIQDLKAADLGWIGLALLIGFASHVLRAIRWRMQLVASGYLPSLPNSVAAIMVTYLVNLAIPRGGEIARCSALFKTDKVPVSVSGGTVLTERAIDLLLLLMILLIAMFLEAPKLMGYFQAAGQATDPGDTGGGISLFWILGGLLLIGLFTLWLFRKKIKGSALFYRATEFAREVIRSALNIRKVRNIPLFILYTILIWVGYWMMSYFAFFSIREIAALDIDHLYFSFFVLLMGGIGFAIPIPGGIGPYHQAVIFTFVAFNVAGSEAVSRDLGQTFALAMHTSQLIMMIVGGGLAYLFIFWIKPRDAALSPEKT